MEKILFSWADYLVFGLMLLISASIGLVYGWIDRKKQSRNSFLLGNKSLKIFPLSMSILASFTSAVAILGFCAETYRFGTMYWMASISYPLTQAAAALIFVPHFHRLKITSAYQYLELRFNKYVKLVASCIFCCQMFLYMSVALYTPSLAIEQVTGIPLVLSIVVTGVICAIYTSIGGIKATVWIDTFQVGVMFIGLITVIIVGSLSLEGGFTEVWSKAENSGRIEFFDFDPNPFKRHSFWSLVLGAFLNNLTVYGSNQGTIQRYLSVKKWSDASIALLINTVAGIVLLGITCFTGLVAFAKYSDCDLLGSKRISRTEQILPYLVMDVLGSFNGLPGLFVATIYSAALSTISAGMNSLAAVCITDFVGPLHFQIRKTPINEKTATIVSKILALSFGIGSVGLGYACQYFGNTLLQLTLSIFGLLGGPLLGVISLGMFVPYANWIGALVGLVLSTIINIWIGVGGVIYGKPSGIKPVSTLGCESSLNLTISTSTTTMNNLISVKADSDDVLEIYKLSYLYYSTLSIIVVFLVGILVSFIAYKTGLVEKKPLDKNLYVNFQVKNDASSIDEIALEEIKPNEAST